MKKSQTSVHAADGNSVYMGEEEVKHPFSSPQIKLWMGFTRLKDSAELLTSQPQSGSRAYSTRGGKKAHFWVPCMSSRITCVMVCPVLVFGMSPVPRGNADAALNNPRACVVTIRTSTPFLLSSLLIRAPVHETRINLAQAAGLSQDARDTYIWAQFTVSSPLFLIVLCQQRELLISRPGEDISHNSRNVTESCFL